jgi:hypothetical protein
MEMNKRGQIRKFSFYNFFPKNRKGNILPENVIFIILNLLFLTILIGFISKQGNGAIVLEQSYAKNIALLIDSAKPITEMTLDMKDAFNLAKKNGIPLEEIVKIDGNTVTVKLSSGGGYQYSFFNNVEVTAYPDILPNQNYIIKINGYKQNE